METFYISINNPDGLRTLVATVEARTPDAAAQKGVVIVNRRKNGTIPRGLLAMRTTGDHHLSGWFQGYVRQGSGWSSYGVPFHVA